MRYSPSTGGFYHPALHYPELPEDLIDITDEEHQALVDGAHEGRPILIGDDGRPYLGDKPEPSLEEQVARAKCRIDHFAGIARAQFTTVGHGQEATYLEKAAEAAAVLAGGSADDTIFLAAEAEATGVTVEELAQQVDAARKMWTALAARIEAIRIGSKQQLDTVTASEQIEPIVDTALAELNSVQYSAGD